MSFDLMRAAFPGDPTTCTAIQRVSLLHAFHYARTVLFRDFNLPICIPPKLVNLGSENPFDTDEQFTLEQFCTRLDDLKYHSEFSAYDGEATFTDFSTHFGRLHSTDRANLAAFKHFAYSAVGQFIRSHNQFAKRPFRSEAIHFFHVFDDATGQDNWHCHFILLPT